MAHSAAAFKPKFHVVPCGVVAGDFHAVVSVAGLGVRGLLGPRVGTSSGILPGSSCGCALYRSSMRAAEFQDWDCRAEFLVAAL
jgi:hypothetical protein